jgi:uncharacterized protein with HEPN domain
MIIAARDRTLQGYDVVDAAYVWNVIKQKLPSVIAALESALPSA